MTKAKVEKLTRQWAKRLGLDHWKIIVRFDAPAGKLDEEDAAASDVADDYDLVTLYFQPWLSSGPYPQTPQGPDWDDHQVEVTIVHELLHCALRDVKMAALAPMEEVLGKEAYEVFKVAIERTHEQTVERLAQALVEEWYK